MNMLLEIFFAFMKVALMSFGGGYASLPLIEKEIVIARGWITPAEFNNLLALDEFTPGPMILNSATFIGMKMAGVWGAVVATLGSVVPCFILSLALIWLYRKYKEIPIIGEILAAVKCMAIALIASTCINVLLSLLFPAGLAALQVSFYSVVMLAFAMLLLYKVKLSPVTTMLICGAVNAAVQWGMTLVK